MVVAHETNQIGIEDGVFAPTACLPARIIVSELVLRRP